MKILVSGGSGRLGNVLVRELVALDHEVHLLVLPNDPKEHSLEGLAVFTHKGNLLDKHSLASALKGVEIVYHLAAKVLLAPDEDGSIWAVNVTGTRYMAEMCMEMGVKRLIHCSSHYALQQHPYDTSVDEDRPLALDEGTDYHKSKAHAEELILEMVSQGLPAVVVSPGQITGPYDYEPSNVGKALLDLYKGNNSTLIERINDYVDVRDVAGGMLAAAEKGRIGERYLLTGWMMDMRQLAVLVEEITGKVMPKRIWPRWLAQASWPFISLASKVRGTAPNMTWEMIEAAQSNPQVSHAKANCELGFAPRDIKSSLQDAFEWYRKMGWIEGEGIKI